MNTELQYRTNNGYDSVLLVDTTTGLVRSDWTVDASVMRDYCDCSQDAGDWDDRAGAFYKPDEYGELVAARKGYTLSAVNVDVWESRVQFHLH